MTLTLGMKLGVNYPSGPYEWLNRIGVRQVYETLEELFFDTHESRYKVCPSQKSLSRKGWLIGNLLRIFETNSTPPRC